MPTSPGQSGDVTLVRVGAHKITIDPTGTAKIAGFTTGNVSLTWNVASRFVFANEFGQTPIDEQILGLQLGIQFTMLERALRVFDIALNGVYPSVGVANARTVGRGGIQTAQDRGKALLLHPIKEGSSTQRDITLRKLLLRPTGSYELSDQSDQLMSVMGTCVVDLAQSDGQFLAQFSEASA